MPYITREDGEHFVIPSYRDVLTVKQKTQLKSDILLLSQSYGEYITLQEKGGSKYDVAFSPDTGYLLGESIWQHFKRPLDMIYCEIIPNTTEAILVIVKDGGVYLDGSFPIESIPEELIIFLTQENNFDIYIYGDVPISQTPETGKFSFDPTSVKSFTVLDKPVFPTLPLLKIYQLQLVDQVLKAHGIGVFPARQIIFALVFLGLAWMVYSYLSTPRVEVFTFKSQGVNPYQPFYTALNSPSPTDEVNQFLENLTILVGMPGWVIKSVDEAGGSFTALVTSIGGKTQDLIDWAKANNYSVDIKQNGIFVSGSMTLTKRPIPTKIYPLKQVIATLIDRIAKVYPGNHFTLSEFQNKGVYTLVTISIDVQNLSPVLLASTGEQLKDLPLALDGIKLTISGTNLTGLITIDALGN